MNAKQKAEQYMQSHIGSGKGNIVDRAFDIAIQEAKKEVFDDIEKEILPLEIGFKNKQKITLTKVLQHIINGLKERHLSTFANEQKRHNSQNKKLTRIDNNEIIFKEN